VIERTTTSMQMPLNQFLTYVPDAPSLPTAATAYRRSMPPEWHLVAAIFIDNPVFTVDPDREVTGVWYWERELS
jgi:hypothetical protein